MLLAILVLTFLALGFAVGSIENLRRKMENPFTNWVDVEVRTGMNDEKLGKIKTRYSTPNTIDSFQLKNTSGWTKFYHDFFGKNYDPLRHNFDTLRFQLPGRSVESEDPLFARILAEENLLWRAESVVAADPESLDECDFVISQAMAERLGVSSYDSIGWLCLPVEKSPVFLRVGAVVRELPNFTYFICHPKLYNVLTAKREGAFKCQDLIHASQKGDNVFHLLTDTEESRDQIAQRAEQFFSKSRPSVTTEEEIRSQQRTWLHCRLAFLPAVAPPLDSVRQFLATIRADVPVSELSFSECGAPKCASNDPGNFHYLAFNFDRLKKIREFSQDLSQRFDVQVDMSQVEAKENFALVSQLTFAISMILLGFGILSIVLFVNNLLRTHLFEVRSNLGTFQAFGLNNQFLMTIYSKIILAFLILAISVAFGLVAVVDRVEQFFMGGEESRFNIFSLWILVAIIGLVAVSLIWAGRTIRSILGDTPGNLIYER